MKIGTIIKEYRIKENITQKDLAKRIGIGVTYLSKLENNRLSFSLSTEKIERMIIAFGLKGNEELEIYKATGKIPPIFKEII